MAGFVNLADITYGPTTIVAARPIELVRWTTVKLSEEQRVEMARQNLDHNDCVEATIKKVYTFAKARAQQHVPAEETKAEKKDLYTQLGEEHNLQSFRICMNWKGRTQDVMNTFHQIIGMLLALKCRCSVEAFIGLVRNNTEYDLCPQWFFTSSPINHYLTSSIKKWDIEVIGSQLEAVSITGCELFAFLCSPRDQCDWIKAEISDKIYLLLVGATGCKHVCMEYLNYKKKIIIDFSIELVSWTYKTFACPSALPNSIDDLKKLRKALEDGSCYFHRLPQSKRARCHGAYEVQVHTGKIKMWREHSNKGGRHKTQHDVDLDNGRQPNKRPHVKALSPELSLQSYDE